MNLDYNIKGKISIINLIYLFALTSFLGWIGEEIAIYLMFDKIVKRGVFYGPICSIYGFGSLILFFTFYSFKRKNKNIPIIFILSCLVMGIFELISGLFFKYILNIEIWSYSGQYLAILDYTTIPMMIYWGFLGTIYIYLFQGKLLKLINLIPQKYKYTVAYIIIILYLTDFIFSVFNVYNNTQVLYNLVHV